MRFNTNTASSNNAGTQSNKGDDSWKSQYFLNFSIPAKTASGTMQIGGVGLKTSVPEQKGLIDFLLADAANAERFRKSLVVTFRDMGTTVGITEIDIPGVSMPKLEPVAQDEAKPQGYLNFGCELSDGTMGQVGFVALREKDPAHRVILAVLRQGEANVKALIEAMKMDFRSATPASRAFKFAPAAAAST